MENQAQNSGKLFIVGIGPGDLSHLSQKAGSAIDNCQAVVGYKRYLKTIEPMLNGQETHSFGMRQETARCRAAIELCRSGKVVALISSGDPGIYGMAGLTLELLVGSDYNDEVEVEIIPGVSALNYAASLLGAPIAHDFAVISLSDLLTPWEKITTKIRAAAEADFVIVIYNPKSRKRRHQIEEARDICLRYRDQANPAGIVRMDGNEPIVTVTNLKNMCDFEIDMMTTVVIGNSATFMSGKRMITPRGYPL